MARLATTGFEGNDISVDGSGNASGASLQVVGSMTATGGSARSGAFGYQAAPVSSAEASVAWSWSLTSGRTYYFRAYINIQSLPTLDAWTAWIGAGSANTPIVGLVVTTTGVARAYKGFTGGAVAVAQFGSDGPTLSTATWYRVEVSLNIGTGSVDAGEVRIDGTAVASTSGQNWMDTLSTTPAAGFLSLSTSLTGTVYTDDWAWNDDQGANQNTWPGSGKVVNLFPISDNARASLWTAGAGGTSNLWDAVNNTPPAGLASASETNTSNIEHAGGAAGTTDAYDANMTTYSTAGIASGDTVNVISFTEVDGEDITTGSKLLKFEIVSNPTIASPGNVTAGNGGGAHGAYIGLWTARVMQGVTYAPSVTVGTSPVMRVTRPETASRVACVCYMAMVVDYTPAAAAFAPPFRSKSIHNAMVR